MGRGYAVPPRADLDQLTLLEFLGRRLVQLLDLLCLFRWVCENKAGGTRIKSVYPAYFMKRSAAAGPRRSVCASQMAQTSRGDPAGQWRGHPYLGRF